jgi:hypothetical protein
MTQSSSTVTLDPAGQALLKRHADWWQRKGILVSRVQGAPLEPLWLPLADGTLAQEDVDLTPEMLDLDRLTDGLLAGAVQPTGVVASSVGRSGDAAGPTALELNGDLFEVVAPYTRVPWVEAILGNPVRATIQGGSMRTTAWVRQWSDWQQRTVRRHDGWLDMLARSTELLVARSGGRRAVVHTLMRGPSDLAEAVLGPELMCLSLFEHQAELRAFLEEVTDTFIAALFEQLRYIPRVAGGAIHPFGIWAPGSTVRTQCDASVLLSPRHYGRWFLPYDTRISEAVDFSIIHLHSCSPHVVDELLKVERPQAIQVIIETGPNVPSLPMLTPIFRSILSAKPLVVDGPMTADELHFLQDALPHTGLCIIARQSAW